MQKGARIELALLEFDGSLNQNDAKGIGIQLCIYTLVSTHLTQVQLGIVDVVPIFQKTLHAK